MGLEENRWCSQGEEKKRGSARGGKKRRHEDSSKRETFAARNTGERETNQSEEKIDQKERKEWGVGVGWFLWDWCFVAEIDSTPLPCSASSTSFAWTGLPPPPKALQFQVKPVEGQS